MINEIDQLKDEIFILQKLVSEYEATFVEISQILFRVVKPKRHLTNIKPQYIQKLREEKVTTYSHSELEELFRLEREPVKKNFLKSLVRRIRG